MENNETKNESLEINLNQEINYNEEQNTNPKVESTKRVEKPVYTNEEVDKIIKASRLNRNIAGILSGVILFAAGVGIGTGVKGCTSKGAGVIQELQGVENVEESNTQIPQEIKDNVEINANQTPTRAAIEADRTYSFSQVIGRIVHHPEMVERDNKKYWDINESAGQITVTRPYGEMATENPHNEKVAFEFYPNDEQARHEWDVLDIRENLPSGAFWIKTDSTGGKVKVEFFDENGNIVKEHDGEMVMASWKDTNGETRQAIQFRDNVTGETRPPSFQIFEMKDFTNSKKPQTIEYPYSTARVTVEPAPGSYLQIVTGPTIPYGEGHDAGWGFYMWNTQEK